MFIHGRPPCDLTTTLCAELRQSVRTPTTVTVRRVFDMVLLRGCDVVDDMESWRVVQTDVPSVEWIGTTSLG